MRYCGLDLKCPWKSQIFRVVTSGRWLDCVDINSSVYSPIGKSTAECAIRSHGPAGGDVSQGVMHWRAQLSLRLSFVSCAMGWATLLCEALLLCHFCLDTSSMAKHLWNRELDKPSTFMWKIPPKIHICHLTPGCPHCCNRLGRKRPLICSTGGAHANHLPRSSYMVRSAGPGRMILCSQFGVLPPWTAALFYPPAVWAVVLVDPNTC